MKKIVALILVGCISLTFIGCEKTNEENDSNTEIASDNTETEKETINDAINDNLVSKYPLELVEGNYEQFQGKITNIFEEYNDTMHIYADGCLYANTINSDWKREWEPWNLNCEGNIVSFDGAICILENSQKELIVFGKDYNKTLYSTKLLCDKSEYCGGFVAAGEGKFVCLYKDNGIVNVATYDVISQEVIDNPKILTMNGKQICEYYNFADLTYSHVKTVDKEIIKTDGNIRKSKDDLTREIGSGETVWGDASKFYAKNAKDFYGYTNYGQYKVFSKENDEFFVYVHGYEYENGEIEHQISLPENYTISDIKKIYVCSSIVIQFNDDSFYVNNIMENNYGGTFEKITELEEYKTNVVKWIGTDYYLYLLMDDGFLYRLHY